MLMQFNVKNHKSIAEELSVDFMAAKGLRDNKQFVIDYNGLRILPVAALFGNNASGKTNILDALAFMAERVSRSGTDDIIDQHTNTPFIFDDAAQKEPSSYEVFFVIEDREYQYGFSLIGQTIAAEWLFTRKIANKTDTLWRCVFERAHNTYRSDIAKQTELLNSYQHLIDEHLLAISFFARRRQEDTAMFEKVYAQLSHFISFKPFSFFDSSVLGKLYAPHPELLERANAFIRMFDHTFESLEVETVKRKDGNEEQILRSRHKGSLYPIEFESDGTKKMITFLLCLFSTLDAGSVFIVDELDCQLHPLIVRRIVRMFHDKKENPNHAQLFFSSHNLIVLDKNDLRRDEIWFVAKDDAGKTSASSLAEYKLDDKRFRADLNYSKNYLAGIFGAIPYQGRKDP
jgi:AAA15 family ATPase/GTPase